jgi:hypothetical protein
MMFRGTSSRLERWARLAALVLLALIAATSIFRVITPLPENWPYITGWEYEWIADALARGEGFSFPGDHRWLFDYTDPNDRPDLREYYATAWEEPIYPLLLAASFRIFGQDGRVVMLVVHLLCFLATLGLVHQLGKRLAGRAVGLAAVVILALIPRSLLTVSSDLANSALAGMLVVLCALVTLWALREVSVRRALVLGGVIGISALTHAGTIVFAPVAAFVLLIYGGSTTPHIWRAALAIVFATAVVISPWSMRNFFTFGEFVPVRTGFGFNADLTNSSLVDTFRRGPVASATEDVPWTARGPFQAWRILKLQRKERLALYNYTLRIAKATSPHDFADLNEAERDKFHLQRAISFIASDPVTEMQLMLIKAADFYFLSFGGPMRMRLHEAGVVAVLAVIGLFVAFKDRRVQALALFILAYSVPYVFTGPFFYRYRYPIEPLMAVLAGLGVVWMATCLLKGFPGCQIVKQSDSQNLRVRRITSRKASLQPVNDSITSHPLPN